MRFSESSVRPERSRGTHLDFALLRSIRTGLLWFCLSLASPALADSNLPPSYWANRQLPDARQEAAATKLMFEIRCLVCQGQSIADSDAEMAGDMRHLIRSRVAAGERPGEVRDWLVDRYGNWISYSPPVEPIGWPLWAAPLILLAAGLFLIRKRIARKRDA